MTLPIGSVDPNNLPQGVIKHDELGSALQDQSAAKFKSEAASRFPSMVNGTSAGNPANVGGPLGYVVNLSSNFTSNVANADPATIKKPDDLLPLANPFFNGLPLMDVLERIPIIGDIIEVITGVEDGDVNDIGTWINQLKTLLTGGIVNNPLPTLVGIALGTVQRMVQQITDIFNGFVITPINAAVQGVKDWFANLLGWQSTTTSNVSAAQQSTLNLSTQVTYVQQVIAVQSGMGVWETGPDRTGSVSFPFALLNLHSHTTSNGLSIASSTGTHTHGSLTGNTGSASTGTAHTHPLNGTGASIPSSGNHAHAISGSVTVDNMAVPTVNATATYAPWGNVIFKSAASRSVLTWLASKTGTVSSFYIDLYRLERDGSSTLVYSSADMSGSLSTTLSWLQIAMATPINADLGDAYDVQFRMTGSGTVSIAGINMPNPIPLPGLRPYAIGSGRNPSSTPAPATIDTSTRDAMYVGPAPFVSIGIDVGQTQIPRFFYDNFNRSSFGQSWITYGSIKISNGSVVHGNAFGSSARAAAQYAQPLLTDTVAIEFDIDAYGTASGCGICCTDGLGSGAWIEVDNSTVYVATGSYSSQTTRARSSDAGGGHYKATYTLSDNTFRVYKNSSTTPIITWVDSSNVVAHGPDKRWVAVQPTSDGLGGTARIDNFIAADV